MTTKHTAGEWIDRGTSCVGTHRQLVASVYPMADEHPEEHAANMRLIAAAPDLLEALKVMVRDYAAAHASIGDLEMSPALLQAQRAIARATEEQP